MIKSRILAVDLGTSGCKVGVFVDGSLVAEAFERIATQHPGPAAAEQDANGWWDIVVRLVRQVIGSAGPQIDAIGVCGQSDSLVPLDGSGRPTGPCVLWMDGRGQGALERAVERIGMVRMRSLTGLRPGVNFTAPKAAWLTEERPEIDGRTAWFTQPKDAIVARMTGRVVTDPSSASRTLLFDIEQGAWAPELAAAFGLDLARLPPVEPSAAVAGALTAEAANVLGLRADVVVAVGAADRAAEALGVGLHGADTLVSSGTATGVVRAFESRAQATDPSVITPAHAIEGERLAILSQPTSGAILDWFARLTTSDGSLAEIEAEATAAPPGAGGVVVLPFFMGARTFRWDPSARGSVHGVTLATTRGDIARAIVEGVSLEVDACRERLDAIAGPTGRLLLAGGAHRSSLWAQILVDVTGVPGIRYEDDDAALVGAMLLADQAIGGSRDVRAAATSRLRTSATYQPDAARYQRYRDVAARYAAFARSSVLA